MQIDRYYERWPGLEDYEKENRSKRGVYSELVILNKKVSNKLNKFIKYIDDRSCFGEVGVKICLIIFLILLFFKLYSGLIIPILVLLGSYIRFKTEKKV